MGKIQQPQVVVNAAAYVVELTINILIMGRLLTNMGNPINGGPKFVPC